MTDWTLDVTRLDAIVPPEGLQAEPGYEDQDPVTSHGFPENQLRQLAEAATPGPWTPLTHGTASQRDAAGRAYEAVAMRHLPDNPEVQFTDLSWVDLTGKCSKSADLPDPSGLAGIVEREAEAGAQRDRLRAAPVQAVLDAAVAWRTPAPGRWNRTRQVRALQWAVDAYRAALSDPTPEPAIRRPEPYPLSTREIAHHQATGKYPERAE